MGQLKDLSIGPAPRDQHVEEELGLAGFDVQVPEEGHHLSVLGPGGACCRGYGSSDVIPMDHQVATRVPVKIWPKMIVDAHG